VPHADGIETAADVAKRRLVGAVLQVISFGDADDDVHHIRKAAAADAALTHLMVDLGRNDELPGILLEQVEDDALDLAIRDDVAVADEHGGGRDETGARNTRS
jgi:hypothetical protein